MLPFFPLVALLAHLINFLVYDRDASNVEPSAIHILSNLFNVNCMLSGNGRDLLEDHSFLTEANVQGVHLLLLRPDDTLPTGWERVSKSVYSRSGYDKGHIAPSGDREALLRSPLASPLGRSADRTNSASDNSQTFLMTNRMPQTPDNNRHTWEGLEKYSCQLAKHGKELYI